MTTKLHRTFDGYHARPVHGEVIANAADAARVFGEAMHSHRGFRNGAEVVCLCPPWPNWFVGKLDAGRVVVGDSVYEGPHEPFHLPAMQNFEIITPITVTGHVRARL